MELINIMLGCLLVGIIIGGCAGAYHNWKEEKKIKKIIRERKVNYDGGRV